MTYIVTGAGGFIGKHLLRRLCAEGADAVGLTRKAVPPTAATAEALPMVEWEPSDRGSVDEVLQSLRPDVIFHCAAQSYPKVAWADPYGTLAANALAPVHMLQSLVDGQFGTRILVCSSSGVYAPQIAVDAMDESYPLDPQDPYGLSKLLQENICHYYAAVHGLYVVTMRPFFVIGPEKEGDVCSDLSRQIVMVGSGAKSELAFGNLDVVRDFLGIRDAIEAMLVLARDGVAGEAYNICSGRGVHLRSVLDTLIALSGHDGFEESGGALPARKNDPSCRVGDCSKLAALGWSAEDDIETTLAEILAYWRGREGSPARPDV